MTIQEAVWKYQTTNDKLNKVKQIIEHINVCIYDGSPIELSTGQAEMVKGCLKQYMDSLNAVLHEEFHVTEPDMEEESKNVL